MTRKDFISGSVATAAIAVLPGRLTAAAVRKRPRAITMWDVSRLERRWEGAGYEDWDRALDELGEPGYDAVRIDAYPHLVANGAEAEWTLLPQWNTQDLG